MEPIRKIDNSGNTDLKYKNQTIKMAMRDEMQTACVDNSWANHAWGALVGVWTGDAVGATIEGLGVGASDRAIDDSLRTVGGGCNNVDPGAITDDGELTCALFHALIPYSASSDDFPLNSVAKNYRDWCYSMPFDIGNTCYMAFRPMRHTEEHEIGEKMVEHVRTSTLNQDSQANGALMRVSPVAVWVASAVKQENSGSDMLRHLCREHATYDAKLSHPNAVCIEANILYCIAMAHLINNPGDGLGALALVEKEIDEHCTSDVVQWYYGSSNISDDKFYINGGHVKHAFRATFYHIRRRSLYPDALRDILKRGGDTDTNCAIVGGMIGALYGYTLIPDEIKKKVLTYDCTKRTNNHIRPDIYSVFRMWPEFQKMIPYENIKPSTNVRIRVVKLDSEKPTIDVVGDESDVVQRFAERAELIKDENMDVLDWINCAQEKHMDAILYLEKLKQAIGLDGC